MSHQDEEATEAAVHVHKDGKRHVHYDKNQGHNPGKSHQDDEATNHHEPGKTKSNCCNDAVKQFARLDKSIPQSLNVIHPDFLIAFFDVFYNVALPSPDIVKDLKQFVRSYHPPIPDIRIAIRSFQI